MLVATCGEIAVRVIHAYTDQSLDTVDADRYGGHDHKNEAYYIGTANAADSYLDLKTVIEAVE